jgi:hypothetical protein
MIAADRKSREARARKQLCATAGEDSKANLPFARFARMGELDGRRVMQCKLARCSHLNWYRGE